MKKVILFILLISLFIFYLSLNYKIIDNKNFTGNNKIVDVVYTWVNGNDTNHKMKRNKYINSENKKLNNIYLSNANTQFNDYDTLKYSIRSILKYAPWIRYIYIVTDNQKPSWFKNNDRVHIIDHKQIIPEHFLPTFNSHTIEYHLHNIPNLSEYFLYLNDDMMLGNYVNYDDFINNNSIYLRTNSKIVPDKINFTNNYMSAWINMNNLLNKNYKKEKREFLLHHATICTKSIMKKLIQNYDKEYNETSNTKFRNKLNVPPIGFSLYNGIYNNDVILTKEYISNHYFKLNNDINYNKNNFDIILQKRPKLICINDSNSFKPTKENIQLLTNFLNNYYPNKSLCEK